MSFQYFELPVCGKTIRGSLHLAGPQNGVWFVFCHGFTGQRMGPGYLFVKIARELESAGVNSMRFDFTGSGESDGLFADMNVETMKSDLRGVAAFLKETHKPSKLILLGHSFGGMIAAFCAGPLDASGIVLLSPVGDPTGLIHRRKNLLQSGPNSDGYYENGPHEMSIGFLDSLKGIDPVEALCADFKGRILLFQGDKDESISVEESGRYVKCAERSGIPADYHVVNGSDHNFSRVPDVKLLCRTIRSWTQEHFK
ncbi:MAG: alpha/beta hydrolase [Fibrobacter sp.]|nr:alpha/beta hydrolase [Fibrobacter sp.]